MSEFTPSDDWLDQAPLGTEISLEGFLSVERDSFQRCSARAEEATVQYLKEKVIRLDLFDDESPGDIVNEVLHDGLEIYANAEEDPPELQDINETGAKYSELYDRCVLLLIAPRRASLKRQISLEHDITARRMQYQSFCELYPGVNSDPERNPVSEPVVALHYDDRFPWDNSLLRGIKNFFQIYAARSRKVIVVFNGHGCASGMLLEEEVHPVPIDQYLSDVKAILRDTCSVMGGVEYPQAMDVVLGQCFGHLFSTPSQDGNIRIICFTNDKKEACYFTIKTGKDKKGQIVKVSGSVHKDLNKFAKEEAARESTIIEENVTDNMDVNNVATEGSAKLVKEEPQLYASTGRLIFGIGDNIEPMDVV